MQLPPFCSYEEMTIEYTILSEDDDGRLTNVYVVTFYQIGSGVVHQEINRANY